MIEPTLMQPTLPIPRDGRESTAIFNGYLIWAHPDHPPQRYDLTTHTWSPLTFEQAAAKRFVRRRWSAAIRLAGEAQEGEG